MSREGGGQVKRCFKTRGEIKAGGITDASRRALVHLADFPDELGFWLYEDGHLEPFSRPFEEESK